jgi:hypothetical protein
MLFLLFGDLSCRHSCQAVRLKVPMSYEDLTSADLVLIATVDGVAEEGTCSGALPDGTKARFRRVISTLSSEAAFGLHGPLPRSITYLAAADLTGTGLDAPVPGSRCLFALRRDGSRWTAHTDVYSPCLRLWTGRASDSKLGRLNRLEVAKLLLVSRDASEDTAYVNNLRTMLQTSELLAGVHATRTVAETLLRGPRPEVRAIARAYLEAGRALP